jgi:hypothetical protein
LSVHGGPILQEKCSCLSSFSFFCVLSSSRQNRFHNVLCRLTSSPSLFFFAVSEDNEHHVSPSERKPCGEQLPPEAVSKRLETAVLLAEYLCEGEIDEYIDHARNERKEDAMKWEIEALARKEKGAKVGLWDTMQAVLDGKDECIPEVWSGCEIVKFHNPPNVDVEGLRRDLTQQRGALLAAVISSSSEWMKACATLPLVALVYPTLLRRQPIPELVAPKAALFSPAFIAGWFFPALHGKTGCSRAAELAMSVRVLFTHLSGEYPLVRVLYLSANDLVLDRVLSEDTSEWSVGVEKEVRALTGAASGMVSSLCWWQVCHVCSFCVGP